MAIHLVIIDALNLIRRVHAAQPGQPDVDNTARVCCQALQKIINSTEPSHIVAVFDHNSNDRGWRAELLPHYKEGRKPMPPELLTGMNIIQDAFMAIGIDSLLSDGDEATDYWGLAGISSSKIPGIAGIGPKAAVELLSLYPNLDAILTATDLAPKWQKKITGNEETARASKAVASLKTDLELGFNLQDIRYHDVTQN
jgi:5'-3' exonuclease